MSTGRFTIPSEENFAEKTKELADLWGADAIRNSDGTHLDESVLALGKKIYSAYFPTRAHNEWITLHMDETPQVYLLTDRILAETGTVTIPLMDGFYEEQLQPNRDADPHRYWEVVDRTTGEAVDTADWTYDPAADTVTVSGTTPMHEYTASFLAYIIWDPVEMYNHLTNDWGDKEHEIPFDIYHEQTRDFVFDTFSRWLKDNPQTDVVRFTTFFYQFTLLFDARHREKVVDWFGCACTVSPKALDDFEARYGYRLRPEDFVDEGCYNSAWRVPRKAQRDWIDFLSGFVRANVKRLVDETHAAGKEAMMFLGDQWIGTEPYKDGFGDLGLDAVVGSIGDGTTTRMIADIPGVKYTEGRFLPYFFPDTFYEGNDPEHRRARQLAQGPPRDPALADLAHGLRRVPLAGRQIPEVRGHGDAYRRRVPRHPRPHRRQAGRRRAERRDPQQLGADALLDGVHRGARPAEQADVLVLRHPRGAVGHARQRAVHQLRRRA